MTETRSAGTSGGHIAQTPATAGTTSEVAGFAHGLPFCVANTI